MSSKFTKEEENELEDNYKHAIIIADYISKSTENKPETIAGMNEVLSAFKPAVEATYQKHDISGLKMIINDFKEMFSYFSDEEKQVINDIFNRNNLAKW